MLEYIGLFFTGMGLSVADYFFRERKAEKKLNEELRRNIELTDKLLESEFDFRNNQECREHNS